jgi:hypothetical protein
MRMNTIRVTKEKFEELRTRLLSHAPREAAAFLLAGVFQNSEGIHFVVRDVMYPEEENYDVQERLSLRVSPIFLNRVIGRAERENLAVILCHTHPFSKEEPEYSWSDDHGESISAKTLYDCLNGKPTASLLLGQEAVKGRIWLEPGKDPIEIDEIRLLGRQYVVRRIGGRNSKEPSIAPDIYSRQILAFGAPGQRFLSSLTIGIVGLGGTGSCVAESLARLGVGNFILIDKDKVEPSNVTRMYGTTYRDARSRKPRGKAEVIRKHLERLQRRANVRALSTNVLTKDSLDALKECDIVFSCTDRHAPRAILNELAYQCHIPVIDVGVGLDAKNDQIEGGNMRVSLVGPGLPCMYCQGFVRPDVISAEMLPQEERKKRLKEGYIPGIDEAPSVISFTTTAAGLAASLFLDLLFRYTDINATSVFLELNPFRLGRVSAERNPECVCLQREGRGDYMAFSLP